MFLLQACWHKWAQDRAGCQLRESLLSFSANTGPRGIPVVAEQEKHRRVDVAGILEEALKGYQVAAQILARVITEKLLGEDRQLHFKQLMCLHRAAGG